MRLLAYVKLMANPDTPGVRALPAHPLLLPHVLRGSVTYPRHVVDHLHLIGIHVVHVHHHRRLLLRDYFWLQVFFLLVVATVTKIIMVVPVEVMGVGLLLGT